MLILSSLKSKKNMKIVLKKSTKQFFKLLPQVLFIMLFVGISISLISPEFIAKILGQDSGLPGILTAVTIGGVTLLPSFIAIPLGATIREQGAGLLQVAGFISALMGIGVATFSMEKKYFGLSFALYRNIGSLIITLIFVAVLYVVGLR
jgi:uncharacterized membrane protein YraQ (UPF0718 family)